MMIPESLYTQILQSLPIPCVDLLVVNADLKILLVQRRNDPARGEWWFPGGRIWFGETRVDAVVRKLKEECGLQADAVHCLGTFDLMLERTDNGLLSHAITSLYRVGVQQTGSLHLDHQSDGAIWMTAEQWLQRQLHPFIEKRLAAFARNDSDANHPVNT